MDSTTSSRHRSSRRRIAVVTGGLVLGCIAVGARVAHTGASPAVDQRMCTWRPVADDITVGIGLIGTVRVEDGQMEVLHRVRCSDGTFRDAWMAAID